MSAPRRARAALAALALFAVSCGGDPAGPPETQPLVLSSESGSDQSGRAAQELADPLQVRVRRDGEPVPGVQVIWQTEDGTLEPSGVTDARGLASAVWTLPPRGGSAYATARIEGDEADPVQFRSESRAPELRMVSGDGQVVRVGGKVAEPLRVQATFDGRPLPRASVHWSCLAAPVLTDGDGMTSASCGVGLVAGTQSVEARLQGLEVAGIVFSVTATPGPLAILQVPEGWFFLPYWAGGGGAHVSVLAQDAYGNPVEGLPIAWSLAVGAGSHDAGAVTDATGWASVYVSPPDGYVGDLQVRAVAGGLEAVSSTFHHAHFMYYNPTGFGDVANSSAVTVAPGTTVRWVHAGSETHRLKPAGGVVTGYLDGYGAKFEQAFTSAGVHAWTCAIHSYETFTITVTP